MDEERPSWDDAVEFVGGPEGGEIVLSPHDPQWSAVFEEHRARIVGALGERARRVEHVGSTSIPGLVAKPIVDIQVGVDDPDDESTFVPALVAAGYELRVREPGHRMLRTPDRHVHVHVCAYGSEWERRPVLFRDWLRQSEGDRALYAAAKTALAGQSWPTTDHYARAKTPVIDEIMERAEAWARAGGTSI